MWSSQSTGSAPAGDDTYAGFGLGEDDNGDGSYENTDADNGDGSYEMPTPLDDGSYEMPTPLDDGAYEMPDGVDANGARYVSHARGVSNGAKQVFVGLPCAPLHAYSSAPPAKTNVAVLIRAPLWILLCGARTAPIDDGTYDMPDGFQAANQATSAV